MAGVTAYEISDIATGRPTVLGCVVIDDDGRWGAGGPDGVSAQRALNLGYMLGTLEARCVNRDEQFPGPVSTFRWWLAQGELAVTNMLEIPDLRLQDAVGRPFSALYQTHRARATRQHPRPDDPAEPPGL